MLSEKDLHDYQQAGVQHIISHSYCGLFLDLGLGKTITTLTAINALIYDYCEVSTALVIAPKRVAETVWREEAAKWAHTKHLRFSKIIGSAVQRQKALNEKADIYVISRDNIAWLCEQFQYQLPYDMIVVDELSSFKSHKSMRFRAMKKARPFVRRFVGLTGTPAPNGLIDLWAQIFLIDRGERLGRTISKYRESYFRPEKTNGHIVYSYALIKGKEKEIQEKIGDICISMKADDYLEMPLRTDNFIDLRMPKDVAAKYKEFEREKVLEVTAESDTAEISATNAATLSNKLLQFANGAVYDADGISHHIHDIKLEALKELIDDNNGRPVLVAWTYRTDRDRIMENLAVYKPRELKTADDIKDWNEGKVQVLLAHPASAGHGLNLQAGGSTIIWYGLTWSLELYQQFNARLYRQGQKHPVVINHLVLAGTHDEDVVKALQSKDKRQEALINSIKAKIESYINK